MRIIQINTVYDKGSVGRITAGLYDGIEKKGYHSFVAYGRGKRSPNSNHYKSGNLLDFSLHVLKNLFLDGSGFASKRTTKNLIKWIEERNPDIIHLHNLHGFYLNLELLFEFLKKSDIAIVWTLHDCWPLTGHCAFFDYVQCEKWKEGCSRCVQYRSAYPYALWKDNSEKNYINKKQIFTGVRNLTIVTPSRWLKELVEHSILKEYPVKVIANGIDLSSFSSKIKSGDGKSFTILGVANVWEKRKGLEFFDLLAESLPENYRIIVLGLSKKQQKKYQNKFPSNRLLPLTRTESVDELASFYRQADVFVNPTLEDNFPTTNIEALACGTPVVTFRTGGSGEALNQMTGLIVKKGDIVKLTEAIIKVCNSIKDNQAREDKTKRFSVPICRDRASLFGQEKMFEEYLTLYKELQSN